MTPRSARKRENSQAAAKEAAQDPPRTPPGITVDSTLPATGGWLLRGKDGRLTGYAPTADGVLRWTEKTAGGPDWSGPDLLPARGLRSYLSFAQSAEGWVHLVGVRGRPRTDGPDDTDLVHAVQFQSGRPLRAWHSLGNPHVKDRGMAASIGLPSVVLDDEGSLHLFLRNAHGGLSARTQAPAGTWHAWSVADTGGTVLTGEAAAAVTDDGLIDVLGPARETVARWRRERPDGPLERTGDEPAARVAPGTITAERTGERRLTHFWRDAGDSTVRAWRPGHEPVRLGGPGSGPVAVLRTPVEGVDCTVLAQRGQDGRPGIAACPTEEEPAGLNWVPTGDRCVGVPALALDALGRVVLAAVGADGTLRVARQQPGQGLVPTAWQRI